MIDGWTIVLDVGKTNAKVSLWDERGVLAAGLTRANEPRQAAGYRALDVDGIAAWLTEALAACAREGPVKRIVPVAHGAAAAILRRDRLFVPPLDYEEPVDAAQRTAYAAQRDAFDATGSPFLPQALNLGLQLHVVESLHGALPPDARIVTWPQFWAWHLGGVMATEVTSLGCHSDLWRPFESRFSDLALRRGWSARMAPRRRAEEALSTVRPAIAAATGLSPDCEVLCGVHDSNAALLALRGHAQMAERGGTALSTGTWFVAMRSSSLDAGRSIGALDETRDCLVNVDVRGRPVPSARFMGGREAEVIRGAEESAVIAQRATEARLRRVSELLAQGARVYPSLVPGVGPFPDAIGNIQIPRRDPRDRHVMTSLYLALMADAALELVGARDCVFVEGPFAADEVFVGTLATLVPEQAVYACDARHDLAYGALRLVAPSLPPPSPAVRVPPLASLELAAFADDWRRHVRADAPPRTSVAMSAER